MVTFLDKQCTCKRWGAVGRGLHPMRFAPGPDGRADPPLSLPTGNTTRKLLVPMFLVTHTRLSNSGFPIQGDLLQTVNLSAETTGGRTASFLGCQGRLQVNCRTRPGRNWKLPWKAETLLLWAAVQHVAVSCSLPEASRGEFMMR